MPQLSDKAIFQLRPLLKNFATKKSAFVHQDRTGRNILCLVDDSNRICLHSCTDYGSTTTKAEGSSGGGNGTDDGKKNAELARKQVLLRTVSWFQTSRKQVQDMCFDPSGTMLLVLCKLRIPP